MNKDLLKFKIETNKNIAYNIRWKTWKYSYSNIFSQSTIDDYFNKKITEERSWTLIKCFDNKTIFAVYDDVYVGYADICYSDDDVVELKSLYVLPKYQNYSIGDNFGK